LRDAIDEAIRSEVAGTEPLDSWQLIYEGSAAQFVEALSREAFAHPAVHHPYLQRLAAGDVPDVRYALRDYAVQYRCYGAEFPNYLQGVIDHLEVERHRDVLLENLEEEKGDPNSDDPEKMPHTRLFAEFCAAAGADPGYLRHNPACMTAVVWRDLFLQKCRSAQTGVGLAAIGIATEMVVPTMYRYLLQAIREHSELTERDAAFFAIHASCDDAHARALMDITMDVSDRQETREAIRFGVISALNLRKAFWDVMLSRALHLSDKAA